MGCGKREGGNRGSGDGLWEEGRRRRAEERGNEGIGEEGMVAV